MSVHVDFTGVSSGFEPIEDGKYLARVEKIEQKMSQAGKPYLNWMLSLVGGDYDGRKAFYMTSLAPNALWKLKDTLIKAFGYTKEELSGTFELEIDELLSKECCVLIGHEEYQGEMRDRVLDLLDSTQANPDEALNWG